MVPFFIQPHMKWLLRLAIVVVLGRAAAFAQTPPPPEVPKDFIAEMQAQIASAEAKVTDTTAYTPAAKPLALLCQSDRFFFLDEQPFTPAWTPPEVLKLHPSWVEINPDGAHVEFGGGFHHFGYDLKLDPAASTDTQNSWSLSFYSEDSPTKPLLTFLLNKTDHVERTQFISNALTEFKRRTGDPQIGDGSVAERLVFLLKFDATDLARASVRDCAAANPKDWMDQLLVYEMDFKNDRAASTRLDAWHTTSTTSAPGCLPRTLMMPPATTIRPNVPQNWLSPKPSTSLTGCRPMRDFAGQPFVFNCSPPIAMQPASRSRRRAARL